MTRELTPNDPLPLGNPPVKKPKPKQQHVEHTGPLGSPVLETK